MAGWFAIKHGITDHPIFKGRPERLGAWVVMLDMAAFADVQLDVSGHRVTVRRGELCASQAMLEKWTGLPRQQLRTLLKSLEKAGTIATRPAHKLTKGRTIVTFCNYEKYQASQPSSNQEPTKNQPTKEQDNNIPVGTTDKSASDVVVDFGNTNAMVWAIGKAYLNPIIGNKSGGIIGRWLKTDEPETILAAIASAKKANTQDPVPYITQALKPKHVRERDEVKRVQNAWLM